MSSPITIEDIYKLFQNSQEQTDRRVAKAERLAAAAKAERDRSMANLEKTVERTSSRCTHHTLEAFCRRTSRTCRS